MNSISDIFKQSCRDFWDILLIKQWHTRQARKFKTLAAACSYLRNFLDYRGDVHIRLVDEPPTGTGETL